MILHSLHLTNFRNYTSLEAQWHPGINLIWGQNAQGKTNLLEAIYFLSTFSSFRHGSKDDIIKGGSDFFFAGCRYYTGEMEHSLGASFSNSKKYIIKSDHNVVKGLAAAVGLLNTVSFTPDDLFMVKGDPQERRIFLDREIMQMSPKSFVYFQRYQRILRQRNNILKELREGKGDISLLQSFDTQLAEAGSYILYRRKEAVSRLLPLTRLSHRKITCGNEELILTYEGGLEREAPEVYKQDNLKEWQRAYFAILAERRKEDIRRGVTGFGPHRDDLSFHINGDELKKFGSQGQQRTAVLALKIGELELMKGQRGEYPIFLLDDVLSELDSVRREALINLVNGRIQTFITGTKAHRFPGDTKTYFIAKGVITPEASMPL